MENLNGKELEFEVLAKSIQASCLRLNLLLDRDKIQHQFKKSGWYILNKDNVELRQRLKMLRKETLLLEKLIVKYNTKQQ